MFKNSIELLDYALRELQVATKENKHQVEIILSECSQSDVNEIIKLSQKLEVNSVIELLRKEYNDYSIQSMVGPKGNSEIRVKFLQFPNVTYCPIVWKLSLQKK